MNNSRQKYARSRPRYSGAARALRFRSDHHTDRMRRPEKSRSATQNLSGTGFQSCRTFTSKSMKFHHLYRDFAGAHLRFGHGPWRAGRNPCVKQSGDRLAEVRARTTLGEIALAQGRIDDAAPEIVRSGRLLVRRAAPACRASIGCACTRSAERG